MSQIIAVLFALAFSLNARGNCQQGALYFYEDASYRIEASDSSLVCDISGSPESDLHFRAVSYNDETSEITVTDWDYTVGGEVSITLVATR